MAGRDLITITVAGLACATTGCTAIFGLDAPMLGVGDGGTNGDAAAADVADGLPGDTNVCFGTGLYSYCVSTMPTNALDLTGTIDTGSDARCESAATDACVIVAGTMTVSNVRALSMNLAQKPLVLIAAQQLSVSGALDAGSHWVFAGDGLPTTLEIGAGAAAVDMCPVSNTGEDRDTGAGGGAGGSFGTKGGAGGRGGGSAVQANAADAVQLPTALRGGCSGANGGMSSALNSKGIGGPGGGAIYLIADTLMIGGVINAGGAGGTGGLKAQGGAGGGGTGGFIGIDAANVTCGGAGARLLANGGGGGEGGGVTTSAGVFGDSATTNTAAQGGGGNNQYGGDGGNGSYSSSMGNPGQNGTQPASNDGGGGGGGGGGAGFIKVYRGVSLTGCTVSPPPL
jgi:hypothetical protein